MDQQINDSNSLTVEYNGNLYYLINLTAEIIEKFNNDSIQLSQHFHYCLKNGSNICIRQKQVAVPTVSQAAQQLVSKKTTSVKRTAATAIENELSSLTNEHIVPSETKKAKKLVKLTDEEQNGLDELLATEVMVQPMLYNPRLKSNKFTAMKSEKWIQICGKIHQDFPNADTTVAKMKERWIHIRDDYLKRTRMNKKPSGSGFSEAEKGQLDELLSGLNDVYELKETTSNVVEKDSEERTFKSVSSSRKFQEKKIEDGTLEIIEKSSEKFLTAIENIQNSFVDKKENVHSEDKAAKFCEFVILELRDLNDKNFRLAQIKILQTISELKDQQ